VWPRRRAFSGVAPDFASRPHLLWLCGRGPSLSVARVTGSIHLHVAAVHPEDQVSSIHLRVTVAPCGVVLMGIIIKTRTASCSAPGDGLKVALASRIEHAGTRCSLV
jgi:hypothetical protein